MAALDPYAEFALYEQFDRLTGGKRPFTFPIVCHPVDFAIR